jgi:hypothetical protein
MGDGLDMSQTSGFWHLISVFHTQLAASGLDAGLQHAPLRRIQARPFGLCRQLLDALSRLAASLGGFDPRRENRDG